MLVTLGKVMLSVIVCSGIIGSAHGALPTIPFFGEFSDLGFGMTTAEVRGHSRKIYPADIESYGGSKYYKEHNNNSELCNDLTYQFKSGKFVQLTCVSAHAKNDDEFQAQYQKLLKLISSINNSWGAPFGAKIFLMGSPPNNYAKVSAIWKMNKFVAELSLMPKFSKNQQLQEGQTELLHAFYTLNISQSDFAPVNSTHSVLTQVTSSYLTQIRQEDALIADILFGNFSDNGVTASVVSSTQNLAGLTENKNAINLSEKLKTHWKTNNLKAIQEIISERQVANKLDLVGLILKIDLLMYGFQGSQVDIQLTLDQLTVEIDKLKLTGNNEKEVRWFQFAKPLIGSYLKMLARNNLLEIKKNNSALLKARNAGKTLAISYFLLK